MEAHKVCIWEGRKIARPERLGTLREEEIEGRHRKLSENRRNREAGEDRQRIGSDPKEQKKKTKSIGHIYPCSRI